MDEAIYKFVAHLKHSNITSNSSVSFDDSDEFDVGCTNLELSSDVSLRRARLFFTILVPLVIVGGIVGNTLCLIIFSRKRLRRTRQASSCSFCLGALSLSDLLVLLTYGFVEWMYRGLGINLVNYNGVCQIYLYVTYVLRMNSVWLLVLFTVERFIGVYLPLRRVSLCTSRNAARAILAVFLTTMLLCAYKPITSFMDSVSCGIPQDHTLSSGIFAILDTCYGLLLTGVPFIIIFILNFIIAKTLFTRQRNFDFSNLPGPSQTPSKPVNVFKRASETLKRHSKCARRDSSDNIGLQFCMTLLAISTCFILLNMPYFIVFLSESIHERVIRRLRNNFADEESGCPDRQQIAILTVTRGIFMINYAINFFLYNMTGAFFRKEMKKLCLYWCCRWCQTLNGHTTRGVYGLGSRRETTAGTNTFSPPPEMRERRERNPSFQPLLSWYQNSPSRQKSPESVMSFLHLQQQQQQQQQQHSQQASSSSHFDWETGSIQQMRHIQLETHLTPGSVIIM